jgi:hypothetical protein
VLIMLLTIIKLEIIAKDILMMVMMILIIILILMMRQ